MNDFKVTRRAFLGGVGAAGIATASFASIEEDNDEDGIIFNWSIDSENGDARVLDVSIVVKSKGDRVLDADPISRRLWRIRPEVFGPDARFILRRNGNSSYRLRVVNVRYGRLRGRSIAFKFNLTDVPVTVGSETKIRKRYAFTAETDVWSSSANPTATNSFEMGADREARLRGDPLLFRDFINPDGPKRLFVDPPIKRVVNTGALMFNGLIERTKGVPNARVVDLWFGPDGKWEVDARAPRLSVFGQRVNLTAIEIFWRLTEGAAAQKGADAPLLAVAKTADWAEAPEVQAPIRIGNRARGPVLKITRDAGGESVYLRMQRPRDAEGNVVRNGRLRAEAVLPADWRDLGFESRNRARSAEGFPALEGSLLQRVDAPITPNDVNYTTDRAGTISFQGRYRQGSDAATRLETGLGAITAVSIRDSIRDEDDAEDDALVAFPARRGWLVTALYSWRRKRDGETNPPDLSAPQAEFIDAAVGMVEAGIELPGSDYARLTFEPTELRIFYSTEPLTETPLGSFVDLGATRSAEFARLDLARATLRASQSDALVALKFRFSEMALSFAQGGVELVRYSAACEVTTRPGRYDQLQPFDNRPVLVVEFPPQHLFEEAKFFPTVLPLPDVSLKRKVTVTREGGTLSVDVDVEEYKDAPLYEVVDNAVTFDSDNRRHVSDLLDWLTPDERAEFRKAFRDRKSTGPTADGPLQQANFRTVANAVQPTIAALANIPKGQEFYIGPFALDVDAMQAVRLEAEAQRVNFVNTVITEMFTAAEAERAKYATPSDVDAALRLENRLQSAVPTYQQFRTFYRDTMYRLLLRPEAPPDLAGFKGLEPTGSTTLETEFLLTAVAADNPLGLDDALYARLIARRNAARALFVAALQDRDPLESASRARLSNPSRLAFRVRCRDGLDQARTKFRDRKDHTKNALDTPEDAKDRLPRDELDFTFEALTNFRGMELSVMARAETVYEPGELGLISARRPRVADTSVDAMLDRLEFTRGSQVSVRTRLAEVAASLRPPSALETSIELPARLTLSPHQNAVILTPTGGVPADVFDMEPAPCDAPGENSNVVSRLLWQARFVTEGDGLGLDPGLRAVHSPDLRPGALLTRFADGAASGGASIVHGEPPAGPLAPWFLTLLQSQASGMTQTELENIPGFENACTRIETPEERAKLPQIVAAFCKSLLERKQAPDRFDPNFRTSIDARTRHQLVLLSSAWGLPVIGRRQANLELSTDSSQLEASEGLKLFDVWPGSAIYRPKPLDVSELSLTALGGTLRHDTGFQPPTGALFWRDKRPVFDALGLERWQQWTNIGRDIFTEVVYKGFLFPLGIRASLVQVTERIFYMHKPTGAITAPLRQRMFIRVANPEKLYPAIKQPFGGRRWPVRALKMLTTVTPDIVDPNSGDVPAANIIAPSGRIGLKKGAKNTKGLVFWPRIIRAQAGTVRFEFQVDDSTCDLPLIFADNTAVADPDTMLALKTYYAGHVDSPDNGNTPGKVEPVRHMRTLVFGGANRRYADEIENGSATYQTDHWTLRASGLEAGLETILGSGGEKEEYVFKNDDHVFGSILQGADQPPFYPVMETARIHLTQTERLVARNLAPVRAHFDARYVAHGFRASDDDSEDGGPVSREISRENPAEVVLIVRDAPTLDMGRKGDQSGGVFRPTGRVVALSRKKGAMTQNAAPSYAKPNVFDRMFSLAGRFTYPQTEQLQDALDSKATGPTGSSVQSAALTPTVAASDPFKDIRKIYQEFFSDDAKLLGLVSIRDLIAFIQSFNTPEEGLPELNEAMEFGAGIAEGAEDAANVIRENVVVPLSAAARRVREGWDQIEDNLSDAQDVLGGKVEKISIGEVFPELDTSLTELTRALVRAEGETDEILFALELGACYSAGQQFLSAVQRSAANPAQRIEEAVTKRYSAVLSIFKVFDGDFLALFLNFVRIAVQEKTGVKFDAAANVAELVEALREKLRFRLVQAVSDTLPALKQFPTRRELLALPRTGGLYYDEDGELVPDRRKQFETCLDLFAPDAEDVRTVLLSFVNWVTEPATILRYVENPPDKVEDLLSEYLAHTPVDPIPFEPAKLDEIVGKTQVVARGFINTQLNKIGAEIKNKVEDEVVPGISTHAEIDARFAEIEKQIVQQIFDVSSGVVALKNGPIAEQIRNRYALCVIIKLAEHAEKCVPELGDLDPKWLREFVDWLAGLFEGADLPELIRPNLAGIFDPIVRLVRQLVELLRAIKIGDFSAVFRWLRQLFEEIGLPKVNLGVDICKYVDPVWSLTSQVMRAAADIGDSTRFVPDAWSVPTCKPDASGVPSLDDMSRFADSTEFMKLPGSNETSLIGSLLTIKAFSDKLTAAATDANTEFEEAQKAMFDKLNEVVMDPASFPGATEIVDDLQGARDRLSAGFAETKKCLGDLSDSTEAAYCALLADDRALSAAIRDLKAAAGLQICTGVSLNENFEALKAMTQLPRDFRALGERRSDVLKTLEGLYGKLITTFEKIEQGVNGNAPVLLALGATAANIVGPLTVTKGKFPDNNKPTWVTDLETRANALQTQIELFADDATEVVQKVLGVLCQVLDYADNLLAEVSDLLQLFDQQVAELETQIAALETESFGVDLNRFLSRAKTEINSAQLARELAEVRAKFNEISDLRGKLCTDETVIEGIETLEELKQFASSTGATLLQQMRKQSEPIGDLQNAQAAVPRELSKLVDEISSFVDTAARNKGNELLNPILEQMLRDWDANLLGLNIPALTVRGKLGLVPIYEKLLEGRNTLYEELRNNGFGSFLEPLLVTADGARAERMGYKPNSDTDDPQNTDQLAGDVAWLKAVQDAPDLTDEAKNRFIAEFLREWTAGAPTPIVIFRNIADLIEDILSGDIFKHIDFAALREEFEEYLLSLVPSKLRMGYGFAIELGKEVSAATAGIFTPEKGTELGIDMKIVVDLRATIENGTPSIDFRSVGTLGPFEVKLVGDFFDALTLRFAGATFISEGGDKSDITIVFKSHKIGPKLKFVQKLQKYLAPKDGSGVILRFYPEQPGIEAGYRLHLGDFAVGNLAFTNVGLETTAILPFSDSEALFKASLSSRANPFTLTYAPYGGSGFFGIFATVDGIVGFEAGFEFGGSAVFAFGPLSGQGRLMSGVYIRQLKLGGVRITEISMTFFAGGTASIWVFNFGAALSLKMGMVNGAMTGEATFCFSFSMGLADFEYSVQMVKQEGEGFSGNSALLGNPGPTRFAALGDPEVPHQRENAFGAKVETGGQCQSKNWKAFKSYFDDLPPPTGYF